VGVLSYWNDNQAGYSFWSVGPDQMVWGQPEAIYKKLKEGYDAAKIPVRMWEPDNHLAARYKSSSGWTYLDWTQWNTTLYPSAGAFPNNSLGGIPPGVLLERLVERHGARAEQLDVRSI
jgi:hypothetical protein